MRKIIASILVVVFVLTLSAAALAEIVQTGEIGANLRSTPMISPDNIIKKIHQFQNLNVLSRNGVWLYVSYNGLNGYVHSGNVTGLAVTPGGVQNPAEAGTPVNQYASASAYGCKMRSEMNINDYNNVVHSVHAFETIYVHASYNMWGDLWYYASTLDGYEGYVHAGNVQLQGGW